MPEKEYVYTKPEETTIKPKKLYKKFIIIPIIIVILIAAYLLYNNTSIFRANAAQTTIEDEQVENLVNSAENPQTGQNPVQNKNETDIGTNNSYVYKNYRFSISCPEGWEIYNGLIYRCTSPVENEIFQDCSFFPCADKAFLESLNGTDLTAYVNGMDELSNSLYKNNKIVSRNKITINGQEAIESIITYTLYVSQVNYQRDYKMQQIIFLRNGTAFAMDCRSYPPVFDRYKPYFDSIIASLKFE